MTSNSEQLTLPIDIREQREVWWINARQVETRSRFLGRRMLKTEFEYDGDSLLPSRTRLSVDKINDLEDPNLRYALRFQDAAEAAGWFAHGGGMSSTKIVAIDATNEGAASRLLYSTLSGYGEDKTSSFLENLRRFAPDYDGHYGD
ncbi:MAG TPA: hypothetical protein VN031_00145 [Candidatus Microsaccharimonas sp.]|nr:hypothetical protein [Candidatus Microsaccharimonas sp.]